VDYALIKKTVRVLRKRSTHAERLFWNAVRGRKLDGLKFLRQYPIPFEYYGQERFFIADFYCPEYKLVVEIDGLIHERQKEYDELRTFIINILGMRVLRIKNEEVERNIEKVLATVRQTIDF
jgi:very-short-patch-repair endonuclease